MRENRFVSGSNLDFHFLRTKTAKKQTMIDFAKKINEEYANQVINANYHTFNGTLLCRECIKRDSYSSECADDFERVSKT